MEKKDLEIKQLKARLKYVSTEAAILKTPGNRKDGCPTEENIVPW
ncbi:transposase IS3 family protein, partial [Lacticaseibacillus rhamnosus MTCC 5462]